VLRDALSGTHFQSGPEISCDQEKMRGEDKVEALFCFILFLKSLLRVLAQLSPGLIFLKVCMKNNPLECRMKEADASSGDLLTYKFPPSSHSLL
jgi:hypothetical protein